MGHAKNEEEVLAHMAHAFKASGGLIGPASRSEWSTKKAEALEAAHQAAGSGGIQSVLDIGIGDMTPLERWSRFGEVSYTGVDGCPSIIGRAADRYKGNPRRSFILAPFSAITIKTEIPSPNPASFDAVLLFDVLYHVPDDELHGRLLDFAFTARKAVLLTYSPAVQEFGGRQVGQAGFAWFPRPEVADFIDDKMSQGWDLVFHTSDFRAGPQQQRLVALVRSLPSWQVSLPGDGL